MHGYKWPINCTRTRTEGAEGSVANAPWPVVDERWLANEEVTIAVQENGKTRGVLRVAADVAGSLEAVQAALESQLDTHVVQRMLQGVDGEAARQIFVPGKVLNFVPAGGQKKKQDKEP